MAVYNFAYTVPFPTDSKITKEQAFEALRIKCREPMKFVPTIVACEVLEETPTFIKRKATTKDGKVMVEDMDLYAPTLVTFKADIGSYVTNLISEDAEGNMLLTFTFSFPIPGHLKAGSEEETAWKKEVFGAAKGAVGGSLKATLEMFEAGKLN
ncbi:hypothetical protein FS749_010037 [Ceratobasidium sp. UAMH 11750]|nr:hypothetical protein FS749_010037 [Ceratobasidium sp. UAMH 11750]